MAGRRAEPREAAGPGDVLAAKKPKVVPTAQVQARAGPATPPPTPPKPAEKGRARDIGIDVPKPAKTCADVHCPFHGTLPVRGQTFEGTVVSTRMQRTVVVERQYTRFIRKYERYEKRTKRMRVHSPPCLELREGDHVVLMECRPIAKTVSFVAIQNRGVAA